VGGRPGHIFNVGHGLHPKTDPEVVRAVVDHVHSVDLARLRSERGFSLDELLAAPPASDDL
jgi:uroporphyrinogen decarboxylase